MKVSNRVGNLKYAIRDVQVIANKLKEKGEKIIQFNIGDPLKFDFKVPKLMVESLKQNAELGYYSDSVGEIDVRQAIANYETNKQNREINNSDVIYFQGVSEGILFTFLSFLNPGDRVLVPRPTYPAYQSIGVVTQAEIVAYNCIEEADWIPDLDDFRKKLTENTKLVIIINPNNPTGVVYSEKVLTSLRDIVGESNATIISDEIYDKLVLEGKYTSFSSISKDVPTIVFNGFSKVFLAPGWRAAYGYIIDEGDKISDPWEGVRKLCRVRLSSSTPISKSIVSILNSNFEYLNPVKKKIKERRDIVVKHFLDIPQISFVKPKAAFYIFPKIDLTNTIWKDDKSFVLDFLDKKKTLFVHGSGFGIDTGANHFRMVYLAPPEVINEGLSRLKDFLK